MSLPISSLSPIAKTSIGSSHYLPLANGTAANYKLLIQDLFPSLNTLGTGSEALYVSITNKNTLNFKGIKSLNNLLTVATSGNNITLQVNESLINLNNCNNDDSNFLTGPISLTTDVDGIMPVANGGTGLSTLTANSLYIGNGTSSPSPLGVATNGQLVIGRTGMSPILATLTAGTNITINNGAGDIEIVATLTELTQNLNGAGYNIYGLGWLSGDGNNEGLKVDSQGRVFVGSSTPTAFYNYDLNVNSGIGLNGSIKQYISMSPSPAPESLAIIGAASTSSGVAGGKLTIQPGAGSGSGNGGALELLAGASGSGAGGSIYITPGASTSGTPGKTYVTGASSTGAVLSLLGTLGAASANTFSSSTATAGTKTGAIQIEINGVTHWIRVYSSAE